MNKDARQYHLSKSQFVKELGFKDLPDAIYKIGSFLLNKKYNQHHKNK